jgi:hypothetical protein
MNANFSMTGDLQNPDPLVGSGKGAANDPANKGELLQGPSAPTINFTAMEQSPLLPKADDKPAFTGYKLLHRRTGLYAHGDSTAASCVQDIKVLEEQLLAFQTSEAEIVKVI